MYDFGMYRLFYFLMGSSSGSQCQVERIRSISKHSKFIEITDLSSAQSEFFLSLNESIIDNFIQC